MKKWIKRLGVMILGLTCGQLLYGAEGPGEFDSPDSLALFSGTLDQVRSLVKSDADAAGSMAALETEVKNIKYDLTNRYTKHVRLAMICGMILERPELTALGETGVKRFVSESLYADGSSLDLKRRDTLTYHSSALRPPLQIAMLSGNSSELYTWENEAGGSLKKSVDYVVPFAMGEKTGEEWTHSKVALDHQRAAAGLAEYQPGKLYDPQQASELMELAAFFDPELMKVVRHLAGSESKRFPHWQTLVNEAVVDAYTDSKRAEE